MKRSDRRARRGTILVLLIICLIPLMAFLALAIDLGMLAVARTQCQDVADLTALSGVRSLNGDTQNGANNNYDAVTPTAQQSATQNRVLSAGVSSSQVNVKIGRYVYNATAGRFEGQFPGPSTENWTLVQATVSPNVSSQMAFSKVLGAFVPSLQATATAVHRPRDVAIILDYSGSMRFQSLAGEPYTGTRTTNNPDANVPLFGHYSAASSASMTASSSRCTSWRTLPRPPAMAARQFAGTFIRMAAARPLSSTPGRLSPFCRAGTIISRQTRTAAARTPRLRPKC